MVPKISDWSEIPPSDKLSVILGGGIKLSSILKVTNKRFERYINFYMVKDDSSTMVLVKGKDYSFDLKVAKSKSIYTKYRQFL